MHQKSVVISIVEYQSDLFVWFHEYHLSTQNSIEYSGIKSEIKVIITDAPGTDTTQTHIEKWNYRLPSYRRCIYIHNQYIYFNHVLFSDLRIMCSISTDVEKKFIICSLHKHYSKGKVAHDSQNCHRTHAIS